MSHGKDHDDSAVVQWKGQLDLDRPCGAVSSDEACWLCEDFPAWNTVIYAVYLELAETAPGTLRLRFEPDRFEKKDVFEAAALNFYARLNLRDVDAVIGLETLYINIDRPSQRCAAEIDALLKRNRNTLKSVEIFDCRPGRHKLRMVEHLAACEFLELRNVDVDGMLSLLRGSTTLKEATVNPIDPLASFPHRQSS
ncbi:hypothetical protein HPB52_019529 [Rhipicephalus sanguineus]|uniref:Uncharacterized protein n=1 Tax=Rhipicephalus sanguineus TaxID=34632 RepID=A0A9D4STA0_RHISA|nr:hypothetical protein HPB52_019529 [Rhipicephalus sanguineus]